MILTMHSSKNFLLIEDDRKSVLFLGSTFCPSSFFLKSKQNMWRGNHQLEGIMCQCNYFLLPCIPAWALILLNPFNWNLLWKINKYSFMIKYDGKNYLYAFCTLTKIISLASGRLSTSERILGAPWRVIDIISNFKVNLAVH